MLGCLHFAGGPVQSGRRMEPLVSTLRQTILRTALSYVPTLGWTHEALQRGVTQAGLSGMAHGLFRRGPAELVEHFYDECKESLSRTVVLPPGIRTREALFRLSQERLRMIEPVLPHWPAALALMARPENAPSALQRMTDLVDEIWWLAGDRSVDFNWYTKRALLAGAYGATELFMLQDRSAGRAATWEFLQRRIDNAAELGRAAHSVAQDVETGVGMLGNAAIAALRALRAPR